MTEFIEMLTSVELGLSTLTIDEKLYLNFFRV